MRHQLLLGAIAAGLAVQAAPCQTNVSMVVTSAIGTVGAPCEPFQCLPNQTLAALGETLQIEIYGTEGMPYVLFLGLPTEYCQPVPGIHGELGATFPLFTFRVATIDSRAPVGACNLGRANVAMQIAPYLPLGIQLRVQALAMDPNGLGFTRATEVHTR
jgi:hypothetical protein